jgi:hypothetical protein
VDKRVTCTIQLNVIKYRKIRGIQILENQAHHFETRDTANVLVVPKKWLPQEQNENQLKTSPENEVRENLVKQEIFLLFTGVVLESINGEIELKLGQVFSN